MLFPDTEITSLTAWLRGTTVPWQDAARAALTILKDGVEQYGIRPVAPLAGLDPPAREEKEALALKLEALRDRHRATPPGDADLNPLTAWQELIALLLQMLPIIFGRAS